MRIRIADTSNIAGELRRFGLAPFAIETFPTKAHVEGLYPADWHPFHPTLREAQHVAPLQDHWSFIENSAFEADDIPLADLCRRIYFELRASGERLRELSRAYNVVLTSLIARDEFKPGHAIATGHTFTLNLALHSFLVELCTLRDLAAEFVATYVVPDECSRSKRVDSMRDFIKCIDRISPRHAAHKTLLACLRSATSEKGADPWLLELACYRNLIVHTVPLIMSAHRDCVHQKLIKFNGEDMIPALHVPIPGNPRLIRDRRRLGVHLKTTKDWIDAAIAGERTAGTEPDALTYTWTVLGKMAGLLSRIARLSPRKPTVPHLKSDDFNGMRIVRE